MVDDSKQHAVSSSVCRTADRLGVHYTITAEPDLPDLLPDGTGTLLTRNQRGDFTALAVIAKDGRIVRAATMRGPWDDVAPVNE